MSGTDWPFTRLGLTFFEGTLPRLCKALERIAVALERETTPKEQTALTAVQAACDEFDHIRGSNPVRPDPVVQDLVFKIRTALKSAKEKA